MSTNQRSKSPFFAPVPPQPREVTTPGGSKRISPADSESKSTASGATFNLINAIVGAGIVGIPFAIRECSLLWGVMMVPICAILCVKSLRLLIETAKHVDVTSYERLMEASFGKPGFIFISFAMFIMAYGAMVGYLIVIKSTLPGLLGVAPDDFAMKRYILMITSFFVILPISMQRDMGSLAKTSTISVIFDFFIVLIVMFCSPISESVEKSGGLSHIINDSHLQPKTFFFGIGVLSFAFVCQHSAFIIAGSLERPTRERWNRVTFYALLTCCLLALSIGLAGFLGWMENTDGNILNNLGNYALENKSVSLASNMARGFLCTTMCLVYPLECFVARHICVVLFFKGRRAHDGDDHSVLARKDRLTIVTMALYIMSLLPALFFEDLGSVFALTGAIGGSCLSYIGPGCCYLAVHGSEFLEMTSKRWTFSSSIYHIDRGIIGEEVGRPNPVDLESVAIDTTNSNATTESMSEKGCFERFCDFILWYVCLVPVWCTIAQYGQYNLRKHEETEAQKSPHLSRLGKVIHPKPHLRDYIRPSRMQRREENLGVGNNGIVPGLVRADSLPKRPYSTESKNECKASDLDPTTVADHSDSVLMTNFKYDTSFLQTRGDGIVTQTLPIISSIKNLPTYSWLKQRTEGEQKINHEAMEKPLTHISYGSSDSLNSFNRILQNQRVSVISNDIYKDDERRPLIHSELSPFVPFQVSQSSVLVKTEDIGDSKILPHVDGTRSPLTITATERRQDRENVGEIDVQDSLPTVFDFVIAISFVIFGVISATLGVYSVVV